MGRGWLGINRLAGGTYDIHRFIRPRPRSALAHKPRIRPCALALLVSGDLLSITRTATPSELLPLETLLQSGVRNTFISLISPPVPLKRGLPETSVVHALKRSAHEMIPPMANGAHPAMQEKRTLP